MQLESYLPSLSRFFMDFAILLVISKKKKKRQKQQQPPPSHVRKTDPATENSTSFITAVCLIVGFSCPENVLKVLMEFVGKFS